MGSTFGHEIVFMQVNNFYHVLIVSSYWNAGIKREIKPKVIKKARIVMCDVRTEFVSSILRLILIKHLLSAGNKSVQAAVKLLSKRNEDLCFR